MTAKPPFEIGYAKPPRHAQWKKGQSGNPKGRPRRDRAVGALVTALLRQRIVVRTGRTTRRMTRLEHLLRRLFEQALAGDPRLMKMALDEARKDAAHMVEAQTGEAQTGAARTGAAGAGAAGAGESAGDAQSALDAADHAVIAALLRRLTPEGGAAAE